jgi:hypothetical protein
MNDSSIEEDKYKAFDSKAKLDNWNHKNRDRAVFKDPDLDSSKKEPSELTKEIKEERKLVEAFLDKDKDTITFKSGNKEKTYPLDFLIEENALDKIATDINAKFWDVVKAYELHRPEIEQELRDAYDLYKEETEADKVLELLDWQEDHTFSVFLPLKKIKDGNPKEYLLRIIPSEKGAIEKEVLKENRFIPKETAPSQDFYKLSDVPFSSIYEELRTQQSKYLYLEEDIYYDLESLGSATTFFREVFYTYPYFDFFSPENNTGKTTAMKVLIWCSYYGFCMQRPTEAILFRAVDSCHGAIGIDEIDKLYLKYNENANIFSLLNSGYSKGLASYRMDMSGEVPKIIAYDGFGLKAFTRTEEIPKELISRSIIITMLRNKGFKHIIRDPEPGDFQQIRDKLYFYRLKHFERIKKIYEEIKKSDSLEGRQGDLYYPLLTMAKLVSDDLFNRILEYAKKESREKAGNELDPINEALLRTLIEERKIGHVELKGLTDSVNERLIAQGEIKEKESIWPKTIGTRLRGFKFKKSLFKPHNRVHFFIEEDRLNRIANIYLPSDLNTPHFPNQANFPNQISISDEVRKVKKVRKNRGTGEAIKLKPHSFFKSIKSINSPPGSRMPENSEVYWAERYYELHPHITKILYVRDVERKLVTNFPKLWEAFYEWLKNPSESVKIEG